MSADVIQLSNLRSKNIYSEDFEKVIWSYKLRPTDNKFTASKAYDKALKIAPREVILAGLKAWHKYQTSHPDKEACMLSTFFNQRRWEDFDTRPQLEVVEVDIKPLMWEGIGFDLAQKWTCASEHLDSTDRAVYRAYLRHLTLTGSKDGRLLFRAPDKYKAYRINNDYLDILSHALGAPAEVYS